MKYIVNIIVGYPTKIAMGRKYAQETNKDAIWKVYKPTENGTQLICIDKTSKYRQKT